jgi:hypothetical protein
MRLWGPSFKARTILELINISKEELKEFIMKNTNLKNQYRLKKNQYRLKKYRFKTLSRKGQKF